MWKYWCVNTWDESVRTSVNVQIGGIQFQFFCLCSRQTFYRICNKLLPCSSICREDKPTGCTVFSLYSLSFQSVSPQGPAFEIAAELLGSWKHLEVSTFMLLLFWNTSYNLKIFAKCVNLLGTWTQFYFNFLLFKMLETCVGTFVIWRSDTRMCFSVSGFLQTQDRYFAEYLTLILYARSPFVTLLSRRSVW
jgi:hypothetical protein